MRRLTDADHLERIHALPIDANGCWVWNGARSSAGYGKVRYETRDGLVHRVAYMLLVGPIPDGLQIDHLCRNRACCNPAHLEPVTIKENIRRGLKFALKTRCPHGHPYDEANTMVRRHDGARRCRECSRLACLAYGAKKRAKAAR